MKFLDQLNNSIFNKKKYKNENKINFFKKKPHECDFLKFYVSTSIIEKITIIEKGLLITVKCDFINGSILVVEEDFVISSTDQRRSIPSL